ncbi:MAG: hypothetical protein WBD31_21925 [Rubripirellula sp.]
MNPLEYQSSHLKQAVVFDLVLRDGVMIVQREEIRLLSDAVHCTSSDGVWTFDMLIPSSGCQTLLHTWQRMIHEPSYGESPASQVAQTYGSGDQPSTYLKAGNSFLDSTKSYAKASSSIDLAARVSVALVGNSEQGQRRVCYIERITTMELSLDSFSRENVKVRFSCKSDGTLDSVLFVNDGNNGEQQAAGQ